MSLCLHFDSKSIYYILLVGLSLWLMSFLFCFAHCGSENLQLPSEKHWPRMNQSSTSDLVDSCSQGHLAQLLWLCENGTCIKGHNPEKCSMGNLSQSGDNQGMGVSMKVFGKSRCFRVCEQDPLIEGLQKKYVRANRRYIPGGGEQSIKQTTGWPVITRLS